MSELNIQTYQYRYHAKIPIWLSHEHVQIAPDAHSSIESICHHPSPQNDEHRHNQTKTDGKIAPGQKKPELDTLLITSNSMLNLNENQYFVDQHIVTLHSPEIEFGNSINNEELSNYKLRK